jgi:hypothetical protein
LLNATAGCSCRFKFIYSNYIQKAASARDGLADRVSILEAIGALAIAIRTAHLYRQLRCTLAHRRRVDSNEARSTTVRRRCIVSNNAAATARRRRIGNETAAHSAHGWQWHSPRWLLHQRLVATMSMPFHDTLSSTPSWFASTMHSEHSYTMHVRLVVCSESRHLAATGTSPLSTLCRSISARSSKAERVRKNYLRSLSPSSSSSRSSSFPLISPAMALSSASMSSRILKIRHSTRDVTATWLTALHRYYAEVGVLTQIPAQQRGKRTPARTLTSI